MADLEFQTYSEAKLEKPIYTIPRNSLIILVIIFLVVLITYFTLNYYDQKYQVQANSIDQEIQSKTQFFEQNFSQAQAIQLYSQALNLKTLFDNHIFLSKLLGLLEKNTHPRVYFPSASFDISNGRFSVSGVAASPQSLAEQIVIFKKSDVFNDLTINAFTENPDGSVSFSLNGTINKTDYSQ